VNTDISFRGGKGTTDGLTRELGIFPLTNLVVANMVGTGVLTLSGFLLAELRDPLLMMGLWGIGGLTALCGALCYGQLGATMPQAGGEYRFLSRLFHPLAGFLSGWISFSVGFSAPIAAAALAFVEYLGRAFPALLMLGLDLSPSVMAVVKKGYALVVIALFTIVHRRGVGFGARVQNGLTAFKIAGLLLFVLAGFAFGRGDMGHLFAGRSIPFGLARCKGIGLSFLWIMFAYSGWNASAYIGSEVSAPRKNLPLSLLLGTGAVIVLYLALNLLFVYAIPPAEAGNALPVAGLAAARLFGRSPERIVSTFVALMLLSSLSAFVMLGPRVCFSMANHGLFFRFAAFVHPRRRVPSESILFQGMIAAVLVLCGTFQQLLTYLGFALGIFPILAVLGVFKLKRRGLLAGKIPGYPLTPLFFILMSVLMLILAFLERPRESLVALATLALGIPVYFLFFSGRTKHSVHRTNGCSAPALQERPRPCFRPGEKP
jgi:basic amino acid/polyamine antiporter, APA family